MDNDASNSCRLAISGPRNSSVAAGMFSLVLRDAVVGTSISTEGWENCKEMTTCSMQQHQNANKIHKMNLQILLKTKNPLKHPSPPEHTHNF